MASLTVIAAYDVSADSRRARLAALLQGYGDRLQRSVFVLQTSSEDLAEIRRRAESFLDLDVDSLHFFAQCADCWGGQVCIGQAHSPEPVLYWIAW
ncbi:MAG: CRISPR-associated endonuclease Cas2 [Actinomycetales bacterium]|nr:CRISPR-associated endonuclease Cas2 [Actinomycetales bacterium]